MTELHPREAVVRTYLAAMEAGQLDRTVSCFTPSGLIVSPVYGEVPVAEFYERLFADTVTAKVDIHTVYASTGMPDRWAAHFAYLWERTDGSKVTTDLVDLFEFDKDQDLIAKLKIVFDPTPKDVD